MTATRLPIAWTPPALLPCGMPPWPPVGSVCSSAPPAVYTRSWLVVAFDAVTTKAPLPPAAITVVAALISGMIMLKKRNFVIDFLLNVSLRQHGATRAWRVFRGFFAPGRKEVTVAITKLCPAGHCAPNRQPA